MASKDYFPRTEDALYVYLTDFKTKLNGTMPSNFAVTPTLKSDMELHIDAMLLAIDDHHSKKAAAEQARKHKVEELRINSVKFRDGVKSLKQLPGYTDAIGTLFGVLSNFTPTDLSTAQPIGKAVRTVNGIKITYKRGDADGVFIYCKRGAETDFTRLEKINGVEYIDDRPNLNGASSEYREYYLIYFNNDKPVGVQSATFHV